MIQYNLKNAWIDSQIESLLFIIL